MVANGQLEAPISTVELQLDVGEITFRGKFIVMTKLTSPLNWSFVPTTQQHYTR